MGDAMTVNERLANFGLLGEFDAAAKARDQAAMVDVLVRARLTREQAEATAAAVIARPAFYGY